MTITVDNALTVLPGFDPAFVGGRLDYDIEAWTKTRKNLSELTEYLATRLAEHHFPLGAELKIDEYDLRFFTINVRIPLEPERPWRGLQGTAGIVYRVRKFLGVDKLKRYASTSADGTTSDPSTTFFGAVNIGFREDVPSEPQVWSVRVRCEGALPETCHLEEVVTTETVERKRYKVVCK